MVQENNVKSKLISFANIFFILQIIGAIILSFWILFYHQPKTGDDVEHLHSAWLVWQGKVPYIDFFQHHNPLMWYLFAPILGLFAYDIVVFDVVRIISTLLLFLNLYIVAKIIHKFASNSWSASILGVASVFPSYVIYSGQDFRPDNYMVFCLIGGIFYYFRYLRDKKCFQLVWAFIWFVLSFLFAQKALFPLFTLGITGIWFLIKKEIYVKDLLKALIAPFIMIGCFWYYLYVNGIVKQYYVTNYVFNLNLVEGFEIGRIAEILLYMKICFYIGGGSSILALFSKNMYWKVISLLYITEFFQRFFYFAPYTYYFWFLLYLGVILSVVVLARLDNINRIVRVVVVMGSCWFLYQSMIFYVNVIKDNKTKPYLPDYITRKITPCDYVFNGDGFMYNIFGKDPHYYWQLIGQLDVVGEKSGLEPKPNMNELILKYKPRFIFGSNYFDKFAREAGRYEIVHYIDKEIVNTYYQKSMFVNIYELKEEYVTLCR